MAAATCARCGTESPPLVTGAAWRGWSRFEMLKDDGETVYYVTVCPDCLTESEEAAAWPASGQVQKDSP